MTRRHIALPLVLSLSFIAPSCNVIKEIGQAATNLSRCSFKLDGLSNFQLAGISLSGKSKLGIVDGAAVLAAFAKGVLPASFTLNVAVLNPNDGTGGTPRSVATLTGFAWNLRLDDTPTVSGDISSPITIPGSGQSAVIPLRMQLDLVQFFNAKGFDQILNLALALGGAQGSTSRVTLRARPSIRTDYGPLSYPGEIDIIDKEFRGK